MTWLVVQFLGENNIEVVPTTWVIEDNYCFWPRSHEKIDVLIKQNSKPCYDWDKFEIKMMCRKPFDELSAVSVRANKACETSEIETSASEKELPLKRIIRRPKTFSSSEDETQVDEHVLVRKVKKPPGPFTNNPKPNFSKKDHVKTPINNNNLPTSSEVSMEKSETNYESSKSWEKFERFQREVMKYIVEVMMKLDNMKLSMDKLHRKVDFLVNDSDQTTSNAVRDENVQIMKSFPIASMEQIQLFTEKIKNDKTSSDLVQALTKIGGNNYKDCGRHILERCIKPDLAAGFSFKGHKGKRDFSKTILLSIIIEAVRKTFGDTATEKEIESTIAVWLSKVPIKLKKETAKTDDIIHDIIDTPNNNESFDVGCIYFFLKENGSPHDKSSLVGVELEYSFCYYSFLLFLEEI